MDLFANEFAGLRGRGFTFALVLSRAPQGFLFGHCETSKPENSRNARSRDDSSAEQRAG